MPEAAGNRPWLMIWQVFCKSSTNTLLTFLQCKSRLTPRRSWSTRRTFYEVLAQLRANIPRGNLFKNKDEATLISYIKSLNSNQKLYVLTTQKAWGTLVWLTPASGRCLQQRSLRDEAPQGCVPWEGFSILSWLTTSDFLPWFPASLTEQVLSAYNFEKKVTPHLSEANYRVLLSLYLPVTVFNLVLARAWGNLEKPGKDLQP